MNGIFYVVSCHYHGCEECSEGFHIVGIFDVKKTAEQIAKDHSENKEAHPHHFYVHVTDFHLNKLYLHPERT